MIPCTVRFSCASPCDDPSPLSLQALVTGAGPIGMMTAMSALAAGCAKVLIYDPNKIKAKVCRFFRSIFPCSPGRTTILCPPHSLFPPPYLP
jgi:threonine dehydrogenase-like Zn-dependent dehydrogenase